MKFLIVIIIYVLTFISFYFFLSLVGLIFCCSYNQIIQNLNWFIFYSLFIGSWVSIFPARDYYKQNEFEIDSYL